MITKAQKQKILEDLKDKFARQKAMIFVDFTGLKVKAFSSFRRKLKEAGNEIKVAKKTLLSIVFKNAKLEIELKKIPGEIAVIFGYQDEISPAKAAYQFAGTNEHLKILGGFLENKFFDAEKIIELAKLPTKEVLLSRFVGSISAPVSNFVYALQYNLKGLMYLLSNIRK